MPDWEQFFNKHAVEYEQIVAREDYQKNIPGALNQIRRTYLFGKIWVRE